MWLLFPSRRFTFPLQKSGLQPEPEVPRRTLVKNLWRTLSTASLILALGVAAHASDKYITLRAFQTGQGGGIPYGALLADQGGSLYGADSAGGTGNWGTIFKLTPNAQGAWSYSVVYDCGTTFECAVPMGSMVMDSTGDLFGVTYFGNVFEIAKSASGTYSAVLIHSFNGGSDGNAPSPVIRDAVGNLYGVNATGGSNNLGYVFELTLSQGVWSVVHLHDFSGKDGAGTTGTAGNQVAGLIQDSAGNYYGVTGAGGSSTKCAGGCGVLFKLSDANGTWTETVLHSFASGDGALPDAALLMNSAGDLYGTTTAGGAHGFGVAFEATSASGTWRTRVLHSFTGANSDGEYPNSVLTMDAAGNLYGTTEAGGAKLQNCQVMTDKGCGTVFELSLSGTTWKETVLHSFSGGTDGGFPGGVILDTSGNLYGAAQSGGTNAEGLIFKMSPAAP
jgi:uncharacterized repeat protein (TIGR03803 family)